MDVSLFSPLTERADSVMKGIDLTKRRLAFVGGGGVKTSIFFWKMIRMKRFTPPPAAFEEYNEHSYRNTLYIHMVKLLTS